MHLLKRGPGAQQTQARAHPRDVRVDGELARAEAEEQHAGRGLSPDTRERAERLAALRHRRAIDRDQVVQIA